jgi:hypothetical protein
LACSQRKKPATFVDGFLCSGDWYAQNQDYDQYDEQEEFIYRRGLENWREAQLVKAMSELDDYKILNRLEGKALCVYDLLVQNQDNFLKGILAKFEGDGTDFDINIVSLDRVYSQRRRKYVNGATLPPKNKLITIQISTERANIRPMLSVARTILHEYVHADMFRALRTEEPSQTDLNFRATYESYESKIFKATPQHNSMAELYIKEMAKTLKNFHQTVMKKDYENLSNNDTINLDFFYEALAWVGLREDNVIAWTSMPEIRQKELINTYNSFIGFSKLNCPPTK